MRLDMIPLVTMTELLAPLVQVFPRGAQARNLNQLADVYRQGLTGCSQAGIHRAVELVIQDDEYFPKVSRLRQLAVAYDRRGQQHAAEAGGDWNVCAVCGTQVTITEGKRYDLAHDYSRHHGAPHAPR
jgi:hypothetical protein